MPPLGTKGSWTSGVSSGTRYKLLKGGVELKVTCTPKARASTGSGSVTAEVRYSSSILVPQVAVAGLTRSPDGWQFLTGQQITGTISGGPKV